MSKTKIGSIFNKRSKSLRDTKLHVGLLKILMIVYYISLNTYLWSLHDLINKEPNNKLTPKDAVQYLREQRRGDWVVENIEEDPYKKSIPSNIKNIKVGAEASIILFLR